MFYLYYYRYAPSIVLIVVVRYASNGSVPYNRNTFMMQAIGQTFHKI